MGDQQPYISSSAIARNRCERVSGPTPLNARRYVLRNLGSRPARSILTLTGVALAVAFFILFAAMSAGLGDFIEDELGRPRPLTLYLEPGSPTPYDAQDLGIIALAVEQVLGGEDTDRWTLPRVELPVSSEKADGPIRMWGVQAATDEGVATPPYDPTTDLLWGRHLERADYDATDGIMACVLGDGAHRALFPQATEGSRVYIGPDGSVDPWWMPDASEYPLESKGTVTAWPRGPVEARVVGVLEPGQRDEMDMGVFVPIHPLLRMLGQRDAPTDSYYYPMAVVVVEDGSGVDVQALEATIAQALPGTGGTDDSWDREAFEEAYGSTSEALEGWLKIVTAIMVVMLVAGVSDTTLVAVADRRREIATLRAVGLRRGQVSRLVLLEVMTLAVMGLVAGLLVGSGLALLFGHLHEATDGSGVFLAPVSLDPWVMAGAVVIALGAAALAAAYPAHRAAGGSPMEALRYE